MYVVLIYGKFFIVVIYLCVCYFVLFIGFYFILIFVCVNWLIYLEVGFRLLKKMHQC